MGGAAISVSAQLDIVWQLLDSVAVGKCSRYSKAQNTALFNYADTLSCSGRAFKTATQRRQPLNPFAFLPLAPGHPGISHHS